MLTLGVFNLFDRKYWLWSDLARIPAAALRLARAFVRVMRQELLKRIPQTRSEMRRAPFQRLDQ